MVRDHVKNGAGWDRGKNSDVGSKFVLPSALWETIGDEYFFVCHNF
jgi:hypothetical protein